MGVTNPRMKPQPLFSDSKGSIIGVSNEVPFDFEFYK